MHLWFSSYLYLKFAQLLASHKSSFSNLPGLKGLKKIIKLKTIQNPQSLSINHCSSNFNKFRILFWFFTETLTLLLPMTRWAGHNTDLPWDKNISKTVRVNIVFISTISKEYSISFLMVCRLIDIALVVLKLLMFKTCAILGISKINFLNFFGTERVKNHQMIVLVV